MQWSSVPGFPIVELRDGANGEDTYVVAKLGMVAGTVVDCGAVVGEVEYEMMGSRSGEGSWVAGVEAKRRKVVGCRWSSKVVQQLRNTAIILVVVG